MYIPSTLLLILPKQLLQLVFLHPLTRTRDLQTQIWPKIATHNLEYKLHLMYIVGLRILMLGDYEVPIQHERTTPVFNVEDFDSLTDSFDLSLQFLFCIIFAGNPKKPNSPPL